MLLKKMAHKMLTATVSECLPEVLRRKAHMLTKLAGFLVLLLTFGAVQAKADTIDEIIGTMTILGNSANPGVSETINYAFEYEPTPNVGLGGQIIGTPTITAFGPLGTLFVTNGGDPENGYIAFVAPHEVGTFSNFEMDLYASNYFWLTGALTPVPEFSSTVWSCLLPICSEFWPDQDQGFSGLGPTGTGLYWPGTATAAVYLVPEPGTLWLSVLGALTLCLMKKTLTHLVRGTL